ncbi:hypothetical protein QN277_004037 [Acacia crassicarpa]|uniref:Uncharacterized protein n=1 Tax=Acacia crassicarpa TaxID=499986 RepID=A0AAE1MHZ9_9FABA|nr:hypothetical protein QN277_004037 [Acacia crassicarpa]
MDDLSLKLDSVEETIRTRMLQHVRLAFFLTVASFSFSASANIKIPSTTATNNFCVDIQQEGEMNNKAKG